VVIGGNLLNLLTIKEEKLGNARRDSCPDKVLPDLLILDRYPLAITHYY
jgi:hypothetical protein